MKNLSKKMLKMKKHYHERRVRGLCINCAVPTGLKLNGKPYAQCGYHRARNNSCTIAKRAKRKQAQKCLWCNAPVKEGKTYCSKHIAKYLKTSGVRYKQLIAAGKCVYGGCKKRSFETTKRRYVLCKEHRAYNAKKKEA